MTFADGFSGRACRLVLALAIAACTPLLVVAEDASAIGRLKQDLQTIASDEYEGRGIGTHGLDLAADYVRREFAAAGLEMNAVDDGAFQTFEVLDKVELGSPNELVLTGPDGARKIQTLDTDFRPMSISGSGETAAPLVFAGYGIESKDPPYDDFEGLDVKGKTVVMLRRTPQQDRHDGLFGGPHSRSARVAALKTKLSNAQRRGAAAVVLVNDGYTGESARADLQEKLGKAKDAIVAAAEPFASESDSSQTTERKTLTDAMTHLKRLNEQIAAHDSDPLDKFGSNGTPSTGAIPVLQVKRAVIDGVVFATLGKRLADIEKQIDETGKPASAPLTNWTAEITASVDMKMASVKNVIGVSPGKGSLANETVVVGAHYDHLGYGGDGSLQVGSRDIHNGADDNASGTVSLLELARRVKRLDSPSRRRIVFIAFTGEERGLLGSAAYVRTPAFPLESTVAMINLDMVGRLKDDKLTVFGTDTSKEWNSVIDKAAGEYSLQIIKKPEGFGPSDHSSFYAKQIPVLHLFTGTHMEYHRPNDDWPLINYEGMERVVRFTEQLIDWAATSTARPTYVQVAGRAALERTGSRPYFGSVPDFGTAEKGYAISGVSAGSPAEKGGLKGGDLIVKLGDEMITGLEDFDLVLRKFSAGQQIDVVVKRGGMELTLKVTLAASRE
ncbi:Aminopeptidase YwaD precursor [Caulifigura coniformis]|uniref:Aminopeptidase YwaD n=1 Tax=Caulifigura coniformis TaxID=2527983 RepID=A0A517SGS8_9PLAN|nr:M28 family peptidase [Caulifigura coniformis]QDT55335.1 Aminopeptidase YwaD precursor [Caulifigura coniformis]